MAWVEVAAVFTSAYPNLNPPFRSKLSDVHIPYVYALICAGMARHLMGGFVGYKNANNNQLILLSN
jgi:hypothetical protein